MQVDYVVCQKIIFTTCIDYLVPTLDSPPLCCLYVTLQASESQTWNQGDGVEQAVGLWLGTSVPKGRWRYSHQPRMKAREPQQQQPEMKLRH